MVNIFIRRFQSPIAWIFFEIIFHILMNQFLKIQTKAGPEGTHDDIGANASLYR